MRNILIVDDEPDLVTLLCYNLKKAGFAVSTASDGEEALQAVRNRTFDLIILDLMLPGIQGIEVCRILRANPKTEQVPLIMLTARGDMSDKLRGLETGADDYITKPFSPRELVARVHAVLRRAGGIRTQDKIIRLGRLSMNRETCEVSKGALPVRLSATEFKLLLYLLERKGRVFSRDQLLDAVWKDESFVGPRTVDVHIRRLRMRIEDDPSKPVHIKTRRGIGYYAE